MEKLKYDCFGHEMLTNIISGLQGGNEMSQN